MVKMSMRSSRFNIFNGVAGYEFGAKTNSRKNPRQKLRRVQGVNARSTGSKSDATNGEVFKDLDSRYNYVQRVISRDKDLLISLALNGKINNNQRISSATEAFIRPLRKGLLGSSNFKGSLKNVIKNVGVDTGQLIQSVTCRIITRRGW